METVFAFLLAIVLGVTPANVSCQVSQSKAPAYVCLVSTAEFTIVIQGRVYAVRRITTTEKVESY